MNLPQGVDPTAAVLSGGLASPFPPGSRYAGLPLATVEVDGVPVRYVRRRFVPPASRFAVIGEHVVTEDERVDTVAAAELGDPELFWRLADANTVMHPAEAVEPVGRRLRVTLPEGVPGPGQALS